MVDESYVFARIGMALISAQRVEFITGQLVEHLLEFDKDVYGITPSSFLDNSNKSKNARKMLGSIFRLLKLNPKLVVENDLDVYLQKRNLLVHGFWLNYLNTKSEEQARRAIDFCNEFGRLSESLESFFKGFIFFLALRHVKDRDHVTGSIKAWEHDFDFFLNYKK
jgi:hypothetical protein